MAGDDKILIFLEQARADTACFERCALKSRLARDEVSLATQVEELKHASHSEKDDERAYAERLRQLNVLCGLIHPQRVVKGRFVEDVRSAARATVRERNTHELTLAKLARIAQTKGDKYRRIVSGQRKEREKERKIAEASGLRRTARPTSYTGTLFAVGATSTPEAAAVVAALP